MDSTQKGKLSDLLENLSVEEARKLLRELLDGGWAEKVKEAEEHANDPTWDTVAGRPYKYIDYGR
jgi:hypothetical protein